MSYREIIGDMREGTCAAISLIGGIVSDFSWKGHDIIYRERKIGEKSRGGIPICFPYFGMPPERYGTQRHGWLRNQKLDVVSKSKNRIKLIGEHEPTKDYRWRLTYTVTISISLKKGLSIKLETKRLHDGLQLSAPINPGFHPYFARYGKSVAMIGGERAADFQKDSKRIAVAKSISIDSGKWPVQMTLGGDFNEKSCFTLWSDNAEKYFCIEPVLTWPKLFTDTRGGKFLRVGQVSKIICNIKPLT